MKAMITPAVGDPVVVSGTKYRIHEVLSNGYGLRLFPAKRTTHLLKIGAGALKPDQRVGVWRTDGPCHLTAVPR